MQDKYITVSVRLENEEKKEFESCAKREGITMSQVLRRAVKNYINQNDDQSRE